MSKGLKYAPLMCHFIQDEDGEGHILARGAEDETAEVGDLGTLTFTEGGPTGGYWKFRKDQNEHGK